MPAGENLYLLPDENLMVTQIRFGAMYASEARSAREAGNLEYYSTARAIAQNAYASALRFAARLPDRNAPSCSHELDALKTALDELPPANPSEERDSKRCQTAPKRTR